MHRILVKASNFTANFSNRVLIYAMLGIFTGVIFGDYCKIFYPVGYVYTLLLEALVYPYMISSIISGLGKLTPAVTRSLFKHMWIIYLSLIVISFAVIIVCSYTIANGSSSLEIADYQQKMQLQQLIAVLIPNNIFNALVNNYIPAVALFCVIFGLALQRVDNKKNFIAILDNVSDACLLLWKVFVRLAPAAVFCLLAYAVGCMQIRQISSVSEYLLLYFIGGGLLCLWLIPIVFSALTPIGYKEFVTDMRNALVISATTNVSILALPYIVAIANKYLKRYATSDAQCEQIIDSAILISYPFSGVGNFFLMLFIVFAAIYYDAPILAEQKILLPFLTFLSAIGSPRAAIVSVDFLTNYLHLPHDTVDLYTGLAVFTRFISVPLSTMGIAFVSLTTIIAYYCGLSINYRKLIVHCVLILVLLLGVSSYIRYILPTHRIGLLAFNRLQNLSIGNNQQLLPSKAINNISVFMIRYNNHAAAVSTKSMMPNQDTLFRILKTGILRVGYNSGGMPFVYFNQQHQLVGYDVAYMYELAHDLNVKLVFIPFTWSNFVADLANDKFDIAIGGLYMVAARLPYIAYTTPYMTMPIALIVPRAQRNRFYSVAHIKHIANLRIGVFNNNVMPQIVAYNFPQAKIVLYNDLSNKGIEQGFIEHKFDVILWTSTQEQVWTMGHPDYITIIPQGVIAPSFLVSYMIQNNSPNFLNFINYWLEIKKNDGFQNSMYQKWIFANTPNDNYRPRWNIIDYIFSIKR